MSTTHHSYQDLVNDDGTVGAGASAPVSLGLSQSLNGLVQDALYLQEPGSAMQVSMGDINQGGLGDCFVLSALDEIARQSVIQDNGGFIPSMIHAQANGTETVQLYGYLPDGLMTSAAQTVTNVFSPVGVNSAPSQDVVGSHKEIWPQVIEKAMAQLDAGTAPSVAASTAQSSAYTAIANGGYTYQAMEELTGQAASVVGLSGIDYNTLMADAMNNDLISFDTGQSGNLPSGLVANHSYAFAGFAYQNQDVVLQNPWGFDNPSPIPIAAITNGASGIVQMDVGHFAGGAGHGQSMVGV